jgi:hypothetical protein
MRKSPIKHQVRSHKRKGKAVRSYVRGHGAKTQSHVANPTIKPKNKPKGFTVILTYSKDPKDKEVIKVIATSYTRAIDEAFEEKTDKRIPIEIRVIDPSIGEVLRWAGSKALEYGKKAAVAAGHYTKEKLKEQYSDVKIKMLIDQAYSTNRGTRLLARAKLRRDHPEVWNVMDISRS